MGELSLVPGEGKTKAFKNGEKKKQVNAERRLKKGKGWGEWWWPNFQQRGASKGGLNGPKKETEESGDRQEPLAKKPGITKVSIDVSTSRGS